MKQIYGVPVGSDGQGIQDVDHTQRQLARRILQETNIALVNAKTIKESVTSDNTLTVHVRVKEEQDVDRLLKWVRWRPRLLRLRTSLWS